MKPYRLLSTVSTIKKRLLLKSPLTISPTASAHLAVLLKGSSHIGVRVGVKKRGCNGLSFTMNYVDDEKEFMKDEIINTVDGVKVFVDPAALFNIVGTVMDWKEDEITSEFTFNNPKSKGSCGCGESFNV